MNSQVSNTVYSCGLGSRVPGTCLICFPSHLSFVVCFVCSQLLLADILDFPVQDMSGPMHLLFASRFLLLFGLFGCSRRCDWWACTLYPSSFFPALCFCPLSVLLFIYFSICT